MRPHCCRGAPASLLLLCLLCHCGCRSSCRPRRGEGSEAALHSPCNGARGGSEGLQLPQCRLAQVVAEGLERWLPHSGSIDLDHIVRSSGLLKETDALPEELARGQHGGGRRAPQAASHMRRVLKLHLAGAWLRGLCPALGWLLCGLAGAADLR